MELSVAHVVNKFPVFYGIRRFTAAFTTASHWTTGLSNIKTLSTAILEKLTVPEVRRTS